MLLRTACIAVALLAASCPAQQVSPAAPAHQVEPRDLADVLEPIRAKHGLPALTAIVFTDRAVLARGVCGVRALGDPTPATINDLWHLGSCTKAMTATLIGSMVDRAELSWDTKLTDLLPDLAARIHPGYAAVTLRQLLTMTAGVPSDLNGDGLWKKLWEHEGSPQSARALLCEALLTKPPLHAPGSAFLYSNASVTIAGHIAELKAGAPFETLIEERLFKPLQITTAGFGAPGTADAVTQPRGHHEDDRPATPGKSADNPAAITPAGRAHMSMDDWARFLMLHVRDSDGSIVSEATMRELHRPELNDYAMGWRTAKRGWGGEVLTHGGSNTMWFCVTWISPEKHFGVAVATNTAAHDAAKAADEAAFALIQEFGKAE